MLDPLIYIGNHVQVDSSLANDLTVMPENAVLQMRLLNKSECSITNESAKQVRRNTCTSPLGYLYAYDTYKRAHQYFRELIL